MSTVLTSSKAKQGDSLKLQNFARSGRPRPIRHNSIMTRGLIITIPHAMAQNTLTKHLTALHSAAMQMARESIQAVGGNAMEDAH